ncbi:MAG: hypothetical protein Fur0037_23350 [Planctomycetota bacterium]
MEGQGCPGPIGKQAEPAARLPPAARRAIVPRVGSQDAGRTDPLGRELTKLFAFATLTYPFACIPFLFLYFAAHGLSLSQYGRVVSAYYVAMLLGEIPTGVLADRFSRRSMLIAGPSLLCAGFAALFAFRSFAGFCAGEILLGLGHSVLSGPPSALLYDLLHRYGASHRYVAEEGRMHALRLCGTGSSFVLGGLVALLFRDGETWGYSASILLTAALCASAAVVGLCLGKEPPRARPSRAAFARLVREDLGRPAVLWLLLYWVLLFSLLRYPFHNYQVYLDDAARTEPAFAHPLVVGGLYAALNLFAAALSQRVPGISRRFGRSRLFWAMPVMLSLSLLVMAIERAAGPAVSLAARRWLPLVGVAMFAAQQIPFGMHWALVQEFIQSRMGSAVRATIWSLLSLGGRLGYAGLNVLLFDLQDSHGMAAAFGWAAAVGLAATWLVMRLRPPSAFPDSES